MKLLWITNVLMPEVAAMLVNKAEIKGSGGWLYSLSHALSEKREINLIIASVHPSVKELKVIEGENCRYYILPLGKGNMSYNEQYEAYWKVINEKEQPDIVHIHGTEFSHGLAWIRACGKDNVVVSIQGLVSVIQKYVFYNIPLKEKIISWQPRSLISNEKDNYHKRASCEIEYLKTTQYFIGRTDWDRAHIWHLNSEATYFHCEEMLRDSFYNVKWDPTTIERYSIFVSQANTSIKGLHQLLKALPKVIEQYPDTKLYVAGSSYFTSPSTLKKRLHTTTYFSYIKQLLNKQSLTEHVVFLAPLNEKEMQERFLKSNVVVLPSAIENSSNSLAEAQILGVPCVASYVGGTPTMVEHGKTGLLYRFEEIEMLAYYICRVFDDENLANYLSKSEIEKASKRHDRNGIVSNMMDIYNKILANNR